MLWGILPALCNFVSLVLQEPMEARKQKLADALKLQQFLRDVEDEEDWIREKEPIASSTNRGKAHQIPHWFNANIIFYSNIINKIVMCIMNKEKGKSILWHSKFFLMPLKIWGGGMGWRDILLVHFKQAILLMLSNDNE